MKTEILNAIATLTQMATQIPDDPQRVWRLEVPFQNRGDVVIRSDIANLDTWGQSYVPIYPDATYDSADNSLTMTASVQPAALEVVESRLNAADASWSDDPPRLIEWRDMGFVEPVNPLASRVAELESELAIANDTVVSLRAEIVRLNAGIDAVQGQD